MSSLDADFLFIAALVAALSINRQAFIVLMAHACFMLAFLLPVNDFWFTIISATIYAGIASVFIKLKSEIRYALFCQACLYYLNSVDYMLANGTETIYYLSMPYIITAIDLYVLWQLIKGVPQSVRNSRVDSNSVFHLY